MIQYLLFDLDNTLYSSRYGLERNVVQRIGEFLSVRLGVTPEEALRIRRERKHYGTTLEWLQAEMDFVDIEDYYRAIHPENEADTLLPDPELRRFLETLPLPKAILTNSPREHVDRVLKRLEIPVSLFTHIFEMRGNGFHGKPQPAVFYRALAALGSAPESTLFIDDDLSYVQGYVALGGAGLLIDEADAHPQFSPRIRELRELTRHLA
ncbi:MAG: HAD-IA family hydrolase [Treponema sp.]|jgi:putative hydrolase of the HAD superfamily|nr:HAD-IA family hydrolase [Treponema sp.]